MVNTVNSKPNSDHLKDAATLLLKGGTLINDPCPSCSGLQVKFQDENICVGECRLEEPTYEPVQKSVDRKVATVTLKNMIDEIVKEKLVSIIQQLKQENNLSEQKIKAELIEIYLGIIDKLRNEAKGTIG